MSSDLWAEFGSPADQGRLLDRPEQASSDLGNGQPGKSEDEKWETDSWSAVNQALEDAWTSPQKHDFTDQVAATTSPNHPSLPSLAAEEDDDFGDFEEPESTTAVGAASSAFDKGRPVESALVASTEDLDDFGDFAEVEPGMDSQTEVAPPHQQNVQGSLQSNASAKVNGKNSTSTPLKTQPASQTSGQPSTITAQGLDALIDFIDAAPNEPHVSVPKAIAAPSAKWQTSVKKEVPDLKVDLDPELDDDDWDDGWGNYNPGPSKSDAETMPEDQDSKPATSTKPVEPYRDNIEPAEIKVEPPAKQAASKSAPPPTNIPPPSVLVYYICTLIPGLPEKIRITIVETWEEGEADVSRYTDLMQAAARIVAGRKVRWKRDTILSQSMKMGMSGRQGGMKLAGIDRGEMQREEREVSELIRTWRRHLGPIRSAMAESTSPGTKPAPLPALSDSSVIRTLKTEEGGVSAPRCCVLCGLKRDERVEKVDRAVWDQFGEWWTEHWGHTTCRSFWQRHEARLR